MERECETCVRVRAWGRCTIFGKQMPPPCYLYREREKPTPPPPNEWVHSARCKEDDDEAER